MSLEYDMDPYELMAEVYSIDCSYCYGCVSYCPECGGRTLFIHPNGSQFYANQEEMEELGL